MESTYALRRLMTPTKIPVGVRKVDIKNSYQGNWGSFFMIQGRVTASLEETSYSRQKSEAIPQRRLTAGNLSPFVEKGGRAGDGRVDSNVSLDGDSLKNARSLTRFVARRSLSHDFSQHAF
jgi:hypothetical protein